MIQNDKIWRHLANSCCSMALLPNRKTYYIILHCTTYSKMKCVQSSSQLSSQTTAKSQKLLRKISKGTHMFSRSRTSAGSTQVQLLKVSFLHAHDNDIPVSRLLARLQKCQPCLYNVFITRNPKVQNLWSAATGVCHQLKDKKKKEAFTIADCVAVPIAQIKNMSTSSLAWFP